MIGPYVFFFLLAIVLDFLGKNSTPLKEMKQVLRTNVSWPDFKPCRFYHELSNPTWTNGESA
jgi:hypothetical protein